jgi:PAS domain S-box-containing protein
MKTQKGLHRPVWCGQLRGVVASAVLILGLGVSEFLVHRFSLGLATETRQDAEDLGTQLSHNIKSHLRNYQLAASAIKTWIRLNQGKLDNEQTAFFLAQIYAETRNLRNIGLAPANRLSYIHPLPGNEAAIGLYYPNLPRQWPAIERAREQNTPAMIGPVPLVQGGRGLLYYTPVFLADGTYWGVISIVIDADQFFDHALHSDNKMTGSAALRYQPDQSATSEVFWGDALVLAGKPLLFDINDPGVAWQLALSPELPDAATLNNIRIEGGIVSILLALLTLALLNAQARYVASYNRLASISSQIPGAAFQYYQQVDGVEGFSYLSLGVRELYAVDPDAACLDRHKVLDCLLAEDQQRIQVDVLQSALSLSRWHGVYRLDTPDLGIRWHEYDAVPTRNEGIVVWHGHISDVTDRIKAEREYATLLSTTHDTFMICNRQGRFLEVNDACCRITGYTREQLLGMSITDLEAKFSPGQVEDQVDMIFSQGYARFETRFRRQDGLIVDLDVSVSAATEGDERLLIFMRDISERKHQEALLRDSEGRFRTMADNAPVLIWMAGTDRVRYWFNQVWLDFTGHSLEEESSLGWIAGIHPDDVAESLRIYNESLVRRESFVMDYRLRRRDGEYRWLRDNGVPRFDDDADRAFLGYIGSCIDVTDYRNVVEKMRASEERLQFAFEGTGDGVWDWNIPDGRIFYSSRWKEMLGYQHEDIGDSVDEWRGRVHPDDLERVLDAIRLHLAGQTPGYVSEHRMRCKDGQYRWVLDRGRVVVRDEVGNPQRMLGTHTDITTMKKAEEELAASESRFRALFERTPVAYQALDREGRFVDVNQPLCDLLGYAREALIGRCFSEFVIRADSHEADNQDWLIGLISRQNFSTELTLRHTSGHLISVLLSGRTQLDLEGECLSAHCVLADISARKQVENEILKAKEAAERLAETRSLFLANMSHEIRTPMNAVLGFLQLLQQTDLSVRQLDYTGKAKTAAESLLNILNDILNFSKIESGKLELELTPFRLDDGLRNLSTILVSSSREKELDILFDVSPTLPETLIGDQLRLHQVLLNLSSNAVKFTGRGEVVVSLRDVLTTADDVLIEFSVTDTGVGISEEKLSVIFEGFTQAESSTTRHYGGTGLGLAISQRLVQLMGGELTVSSQLGVGSCFSFTLAFPYVPGINTQAVLEAQESRIRVLVVDDNPHGITSFRSLARRVGWDVDAVESGEAALALMTSRDPTEPDYRALFVDRRMTSMDGFSTIRGLRQIPQSATIPMILMDNRQNYEVLTDDAIPETDRPDAVLVRPATSSMLLDAYTEACDEGLFMDSRIESRGKGELLAGLRLLLVEDNPFNQQVASELLTRNGAVVDIAGNGQEGVDRALGSPQPYDAILMDVQMPVMDGYEATRQIRQKGNPDQIIIAMTANAFRSDQEACLAAGMNAYIGKPFAVDNMLQMILQARNPNPTPSPADPDTTMNSTETSPPSSTSNPAALDTAFDIDAALGMLDQDRDLLVEMVRMFWSTYPTQRATLGTALASGDSVQARGVAHSLKGNAGYFAALEFKERAARLEILCQADQMAEAGRYLSEFDAAVERFRQACIEQGVA